MVVVFFSVVEGFVLIEVVEEVVWPLNSIFDDVVAEIVEDVVDVDVVDVVVFEEEEVEGDDSPNDEETVPKSDRKVVHAIMVWYREFLWILYQRVNYVNQDLLVDVDGAGIYFVLFRIFPHIVCLVMIPFPQLWQREH